VTFRPGPGSFPDGPEIELPAGDVTDGVVRVGDTVRRPPSETSEYVAAYLQHLTLMGFHGVPRFLGRDAQGRDVLTFLDGDVPGDPVEPWAAADGVLPGVARLLRRLHDASRGFAGPPRPRQYGRPAPRMPVREPRIVAHRDVTPQNTVFRDGVAWGLVDFDLCGETTRSIDLANTAMHWVPLCDPADRPAVYDGTSPGPRLRVMLEAYGGDAVSAAQLLTACELRFAGAYDAMRWSAETLGGGWARMWEQGVGDKIQRRIAWFAETRPELAAALE
jgi:phosphotransferase family enzyme